MKNDLLYNKSFINKMDILSSDIIHIISNYLKYDDFINFSKYCNDLNIKIDYKYLFYNSYQPSIIKIKRYNEDRSESYFRSFHLGMSTIVKIEDNYEVLYRNYLNNNYEYFYYIYNMRIVYNNDIKLFNLIK